MPEKTTKESVQPSRGFLSRIFGSDPMTPEMQQGIDMARKEMPDMAPVEPYGFFSRLLQPKALGYASPGNTIYMNSQANQGQSAQDVADTLTHEQEHIKQNRASGYGPTMNFLSQMFKRPMQYSQRPDEMAAFQAEKNRRSRMGRQQTAVPSFETGEFRVPQDINLPLDRPKAKPSVIMPKTMY
jgi:hypothetical protein